MIEADWLELMPKLDQSMRDALCLACTPLQAHPVHGELIGESTCTCMITYNRNIKRSTLLMATCRWQCHNYSELEYSF